MQNVIVTGGSRGLGLAMARTLAAGGYRIIALARGSTEDLMAASRAAADSGEATRAETCEERGVSEDRIHARHERIWVRGQAAIGAGVMLPDVKDRA